MSHHLDDSLLLQHRLLAVLVVLSKSQLRIDGVVREAQRCNGEKHWLVARHTQVHTSGGRPPRVKARGVQFGMVPPRRSGSALCTIASAILRLVGRNLGRIRWAKHATPREHHRVREGVEV